MSAAVPQVELTPGGLSLSRLVAGVWRMAEWRQDLRARVRWIEAVVELGITSFDHADIYGDHAVETLFGDALAATPGLRDRIQLISKCGIKLVSAARPTHAIKSYDSSGAHVVASVDASLRALRTDRIDLLLLHRPDFLMDPDALASAFDALRAAGKVRAFGVSNHAPASLAMLHRRHALATNQIEFSPMQLQALTDGTLDQCTDLGMRPMIWSPLGGGRLFSAQDPQTRRVRTELETLGRRDGVSAAAVAFAWILRHPSGPLPITGSGRIEALRDAVSALDVRLSAEDWYRVWQASTGREVP